MTRTEQLQKNLHKEVDEAQEILTDLKATEDISLLKHFVKELSYQLKEVNEKILDIENFNKVLAISNL